MGAAARFRASPRPLLNFPTRPAGLPCRGLSWEWKPLHERDGSPMANREGLGAEKLAGKVLGFCHLLAGMEGAPDPGAAGQPGPPPFVSPFRARRLNPLLPAASRLFVLPVGPRQPPGRPMPPVGPPRFWGREPATGFRSLLPSSPTPPRPSRPGPPLSPLARPREVSSCFTVPAG